MTKLLTVFAALLMSFAASAATIINPLPNNIQNGQPADATKLMGNFNQIVNNVNGNAAAINAANVFSAPQQFSAAVTPNQGVIASQLQNDTMVWLGIAGGTANALTATPSIAPVAYTSGQRWKTVAAFTNTGAVTINIGGLGVRAITKFGAAPLLPGDITAGQILALEDDGIELQLINPLQPGGLPYVDATGSANAITGAYSTRTNLTLVDGLDLTVGIATPNTSASVTFTPVLNGITAPTWNVIKFVNNAEVPLSVGDIQGDAWFKADVPNSVWILMNPATVATRSINDNTTYPASTAFVLNQASTTIPLANTPLGTIGTSTLFARADHTHPSVPAIAGNYLSHPVMLGGTISASTVKVNEVYVGRPGTYRTVFHVTGQAGNTTTAQVYKNGVAFGALHSITGGTSTFTEDLTFAAGDLVQLYVGCNGGPGFTATGNMLVLEGNPQGPAVLYTEVSF